MIQFELGTCILTTEKELLETFAKDNYLRFYKKEKMKHVTQNDKRLPKLKITDDIFSLQIWFKDKSKNEHRLFIDGSISRDKIKIHTITTNTFTLNSYEYSSYMDILKSLTKISDGYILVSSNSTPLRIQNGEVQKYEELLGEMYSHLSPEKQSEVETIYKWLLKTKESE